MKITINENYSEFRVRLTAGDREDFDWMLSEFKSWIPQSCRHYADGHWLVKRSQRSSLNSWLQQMSEAGATIIEEDGEADDEDYDERYRHQEQHWQQAGSPRQKPAVEDAYTRLHLLPTAPTKLIEAARRVLLIECHPDRGGRHEEAVLVNRAADELLKRRRLTAEESF